MKVTPLEYFLIFIISVALVIVLYKGSKYFFKFFQWLFNKQSRYLSRGSNKKKKYAEKRSADRRYIERRIFNRGFFVKKGFFDEGVQESELNDNEVIDRRIEERRNLERRSNNLNKK